MESSVACDKDGTKIAKKAGNTASNGREQRHISAIFDKDALELLYSYDNLWVIQLKLSCRKRPVKKCRKPVFDKQ